MKTFFKKRKNIVLIILLLICVIINIFSRSKPLVEKYYSTGVYPAISKGLRMVFGSLPFSAGDILYTLFAVFLLYKFIRFFRKLFKRKIDKKYLSSSIYTLLFTILSIYFLFNFLWGINYNREGIASQLHLSIAKKYSTQQLDSLTKDLIVKVNANRTLLGNEINFPNDQTLFNEAVQSYASVSLVYPFLKYEAPSIKAPVYNWLGAYLDYTGYYNPFTGEAQVDTAFPKVVLPYVVCHEMAHQLGYATEDEANFVGYLSATNSFDPLFKYAACLDLYQYANYELFVRDSSLAKKNYQLLDTLVKKDLHTIRDFIRSHQNPVGELATKLYSQYLKANKQPQGINTYNMVTAWLIAYKEKYNTN